VAASEESMTLASQFQRFIKIGWLANSGHLTATGGVVPPILTFSGFQECVVSAHSLPPQSAECRLPFLKQ